MTDTTLPPGEYAIVECLGHRTLVGRIAEDGAEHNGMPT